MKLEDIKPGWYLLSKQGQRTVPMEVVFCGETLQAVEQSTGRRVSVQTALDKGWKFARLVPAEEVLNAWKESAKACDRPLTARSMWYGSRAKRIAEGLE